MKYIERAAYVLVLLAVALHLAFPLAAPYVLSVGAAGVAVARLRERYEGTNIRLRRNLRTRHLVGILFVVAAYAMFPRGATGCPSCSWRLCWTSIRCGSSVGRKGETKENGHQERKRTNL